MSAFCPRISIIALVIGLVSAAAAAPPPKKVEEDPTKPVSYFKQIRPIFQANCQGCHQPAKAKGDYIMTDFAKLIEGGEEAKKDGKKAVAPGKPTESNLVKLIVPTGGEAEMPKKKQPLNQHDIDLVTRWIAEGATDDTPVNARQRYSAEHPPEYSAPPVITSVAFSPDGSLMAVAGFHEILLWKGDGSALAGRLVGLSERVQSVRFSPDGKKLAAAAGRPAQMGELQVWDVAQQKLLLSLPQGFDTLYGASWSPDGKHIAFGCPDNTVRAVDATTGQQTLFMSLHSDWPIDTAWGVKGEHVVSVSRDMSVKLTEVGTQRFIDNITSITPGALRGGMHAVARHPSRDEILIGGADGLPQIYRMFRTAARKIGDNSNLVRRFPPMEGRIYSVQYAPDGVRCAAGSSLDGEGQLNIMESESDDGPPEELKKIMEKVAASQTEPEKKQLEEYFTKSVKLLHSVKVPGGVYSVSWRPDGKAVAAAGEDGHVRIVSAESGQIVKDFVPVPLNGQKIAGQPAAEVKQ